MDAVSLGSLAALEREGWDALCRSEGDVFYGRLMTPDALMILVDGSVLDRDAVAASLAQAPPWSRYELTDERLVPVAADAAALVYRARAERDGEQPFTALMTSVYRVLDGEPRLVLYQQTPA
ncbi:nuclear transport factor 2 family protein [Actinotalea caeni]|uniref:nuclear transport factor 2 family protein n=1 Tax=Actinotalea caeni TaxID=1348467 RepID=UPI0012E0EF62|nr:nuclear transport factor 2 family protein [Actinotalea caeni]